MPAYLPAQRFMRSSFTAMDICWRAPRKSAAAVIDAALRLLGVVHLPLPWHPASGQGRRRRCRPRSRPTSWRRAATVVGQCRTGVCPKLHLGLVHREEATARLEVAREEGALGAQGAGGSLKLGEDECLELEVQAQGHLQALEERHQRHLADLQAVGGGQAVEGRLGGAQQLFELSLKRHWKATKVHGGHNLLLL
ncbi:hypothetical protein TYRP_003038, partial [Tyrophagus putrescentiae]